MNSNKRTVAKPKSIAIFGVGAMGCLFAGKLNQTIGSASRNQSPAVQVTMFGTWPEQVKALRARGLTILNPDGSQFQVDVSVTSDLSEVPPADLALMLVKSYQTEKACRVAKQVLKKAGLALTLQNGMGNLEILGRSVGTARAALGVTMQAASVIEPGCLAHTGIGPTYLARRLMLQRELGNVAALFRRAGLSCTVIRNLDGLLWGKIAINAAINPLSALLEVENGALLVNSRYREVMLAAVEEAAEAAAAQTILLPFTDPRQKALDVCKATSHNRSSMLQDLMRSAPTEIDAICGAVVRVGKWFGFPTPVNQFLLREVRSKEKGRPFNPTRIDELLENESFFKHSRPAAAAAV